MSTVRGEAHGSISYDDVVLFGLALQRVGLLLSSNLQLTSDEMISGIFGRPDGDAFRRSYRRFDGIRDQAAREARKRKAIALRLVDLFGLTANDAHAMVQNVAQLPIA